MPDTAPAAVTRPRRMRRAIASRYLNDVHGIEMTEKTLRNRNAAGLDPKPEYLGTIPFYQPEVLDAFAATAFTPESPVTVTRRRMATAEASRSAKQRPSRIAVDPRGRVPRPSTHARTLPFNAPRPGGPGPSSGAIFFP